MEYTPSKSRGDLRVPAFHCAFAGTGCRPNLGKYLLKEKFLFTRFLKKILIPQVMRSSRKGKINDLGNKRFRLLFGDYTKCKIPRGHFLRKRFSYMLKKDFDHIFFQIRERSWNLTKAYARTFSSALSGYWKKIPMWYNMHHRPPPPVKVVKEPKPIPAAEPIKAPVPAVKGGREGPPPPRGLLEKQMLQGLLESLALQGKSSLYAKPREGFVTYFAPPWSGPKPLDKVSSDEFFTLHMQRAVDWDGKSPHICSAPHGDCDRTDPVVWVSSFPIREVRRLALWTPDHSVKFAKILEIFNG
jgi:hypothetical protein